MQRTKVDIIICWAVVILLFVIVVLLPGYMNIFHLSDVKQSNIVIRIFYSLFLSHPYLRAIQLLQTNHNHSKNDALSFADYRAIDLGLEYIISRGGYLLIGFIIMLLALQSIFNNLQILHLLAVILYSSSIILLDVGLEGAVKSNKKEEPTE